jgi:hypothetical protein
MPSKVEKMRFERTWSQSNAGEARRYNRLILEKQRSGVTGFVRQFSKKLIRFLTKQLDLFEFLRALALERSGPSRSISARPGQSRAVRSARILVMPGTGEN